MIHLNRNSASQYAYVNLGEFADGLTWLYWKCTNRLTGVVFTFYTPLPLTTNRYSKVLIDTIDLSDYDAGLYSYEFWAQDDDTTIPTGESDAKGFLYLHGTAFSPDKYDEQDNTFKTYQG